ncbi:MAG: TIGR01777 family oxidoreductase [Verrucomicrobia bacterium]|nr:TIGR01777 family oxidoreductase [Verrucomicrobiota bacterium]
MEIGLTGASGFLGRAIIQKAAAQGHKIVGFSRRPTRSIPGCRRTELFSTTPHFNNLEAVIHLAGESIFGIWTASKRKRIFRSRIEGTRSVVKGIQGAPNPPKVLVCASAIGIYGDRGDEELTERQTAAAGQFLSEVTTAWEAEANEVGAVGVRVVCVRTAMVLGRKGALALMLPAFRAGLGGQLGDGDQWMSWIHIDDIASIFLRAVTDESLAGPINGAAPNPVRNSEFTKTLSAVLNKPSVFNVPSFLLRTLFLEESAIVLSSQRVIPEKLLASGFEFRFPSLRGALEEIIKG